MQSYSISSMGSRRHSCPFETSPLWFTRRVSNELLHQAWLSSFDMQQYNLYKKYRSVLLRRLVRERLHTVLAKPLPLRHDLTARHISIHHESRFGVESRAGRYDICFGIQSTWTGPRVFNQDISSAVGDWKKKSNKVAQHIIPLITSQLLSTHHLFLKHLYSFTNSLQCTFRLSSLW